MASVCPYHSKRWRGETQHLINTLRGKLFQARYVKRFRRVICSCEGKQSRVPPKGKEELSQWLDTVSDSVVPQGAKKVLRDMLSTSDSALLDVVTMTRQASIGDLQYFESSSKANTELHVEPIALQDRFKLDFPAAYLGLLVGVSGTHIKALCKQHEVTVHFTGEDEDKGEDEGKHKRKNPHVTGPAVWAVVKHLPGASVEEFKLELKQKAERVVAKRKEHESSVRTHMKIRAEQRRVSRQNYAQAGTRTRYSDGENSQKEAAIGHFEKKANKHTKREMPKAPHLTDGHCLKCGAPFNPKSNSGCTYHSGYLVSSESGKHEWSCCHKETEEAHPDLEMHKTTGCCSGRHVWRPAKGVRRKHHKTSDHRYPGLDHVII